MDHPRWDLDFEAINFYSGSSQFAGSAPGRLAPGQVRLCSGADKARSEVAAQRAGQGRDVPVRPCPGACRGLSLAVLRSGADGLAHALVPAP